MTLTTTTMTTYHHHHNNNNNNKHEKHDTAQIMQPSVTYGDDCVEAASHTIG